MVLRCVCPTADAPFLFAEIRRGYSFTLRGGDARLVVIGLEWVHGSAYFRVAAGR